LPRPSDEPEGGARVSSLGGEFKSPTRGRFVLSLQVPNSDGQAAEVTQIRWELWKGAERFALGVEHVSLPLPGQGGTLAFELPVALVEPVALDSPSWIMGIRGHLLAQRGGRQWDIEFREVRAVPVRLTPPAREPD